MAKSRKTAPEFLKASGQGVGLQGQFTSEQILAIHRVHGYLQSEGALSDLSFEYRHHLCRASFNLSGDGENAPVTSVRFSERYVGPSHWQYMIDTVVDGVLPQSTDFMCNVPARIIDEAFLEMIAARVKAESVKLYEREPEMPALELKALLMRLGQKPS
jgi:hypothetical protein